MRHALSAFLAAALAAAASAQPPADPAPPPAAAAGGPLSTYKAMGSAFAVGAHLEALGWTDAQVAAFMEGIRAAFAGQPYPMDDAARRALAGVAAQVRAATASASARGLSDPARLAQYVKETCRRLGLDQAASGLCYSISSAGKGARPGPDDAVVISCDARAPDGQTKLAALSSPKFRVRVADLLPGLREGVQMMAVGGEGVFLLPPALSFGKGPWPKDVGSGEPILFSVRLLEVVPAGAAPSGN
jgi:FKBP-type peptidyl-prolyl cis-trans isomerase